MSKKDIKMDHRQLNDAPDLLYAYNPLVDAADTLFSLCYQLQKQTQFIQTESLKKHIINELQQFHQKTQGHYPLEQINLARYALCEIIEELINQIPNQPKEKENTLLTALHYQKIPSFFTKTANRILSESHRYNHDFITFFILASTFLKSSPLDSNITNALNKKNPPTKNKQKISTPQPSVQKRKSNRIIFILSIITLGSSFFYFHHQSHQTSPINKIKIAHHQPQWIL